MSTDLTVVNNAPITQGGKGVNLDSKWYKNVKPATVIVVQKLSTVPEDVRVGNLYIKDFGKQFKEMRCVLLHDPSENRQYHLGKKGELNKKPENLACFSFDMLKPHPQAKLPQALTCANCDKGDWGPFNEYKKDNNGATNRDLIPPCEKSISLSLLDTELKMPLRMFIGNNQKAGFDTGMENIARLILMKKAEGLDPNIYDITFTLSTKIVQKGQFSNYIPTFTDVRYLTEEEKARFGMAFKLFTERDTPPVEVPTVEATIQKESSAIDNAVMEGEYVDVVDASGEIKV